MKKLPAFILSSLTAMAVAFSFAACGAPAECCVGISGTLLRGRWKRISGAESALWDFREPAHDRTCR